MTARTGGSRLYRRLQHLSGRVDAALPIAVKLALPLSAVGATGSALLGWALSRRDARRTRAEIEERAKLIAESVRIAVARNGEANTLQEIRAELQRCLDALVRAERSILMVSAQAVRNGTSTIIASSCSAQVQDVVAASGGTCGDAESTHAPLGVAVETEVAGRRAVGVGVPLVIVGQTALTMRVLFSAADQERARQGLVRSVLLGMTGVLVLFATTLFVAYRILVWGRLRRLLAAVSRMRAGDLGTRIQGVTTAGAKDEVLRLSWEFNALAEAVETLRSRLQDLASTDELTRLYNRRYFLDALEREVRLAGRRGEPFGLVLADVDDLKALNDSHGHRAGDGALRRVAEALRSAIRASDVVARLGGDEFGVLLPDCGPQSLNLVLERIRQAIDVQGRLRLDDGGFVHFAVSAGGAVFEDGDDAERLMRRADIALYKAKRARRNLGRSTTSSYAGAV